MNTILSRLILLTTFNFLFGQCFSQVVEPYTPEDSISTYYSNWDLTRINDQDTTTNTTWYGLPHILGNDTINLYMNYSSPVILSEVKIKAGQENGDYNAPAQMILHRGGLNGPILLSIAPSYSAQTYSFTNNTSDSVYTWEIIQLPSNTFMSLHEITTYSQCTETSASISESACFGYSSPSGNYYWNTSGLYKDTIDNQSGCDSILTINLTINDVDTGVIQNGNTLSSQSLGSFYQWFECNTSNYIPLIGETTQDLIVVSNGAYAVEVQSPEGCVDTSACITINTVGLNDLVGQSVPMCYPNPVDEKLVIDFVPEIVYSIVISDISGSVIMDYYPNEEKNILDLENFYPGCYYVTFRAEDGQFICKRKIIKL